MSQKVIYELDGKKLYGTPVSKEQAAALGLDSCDEEPCSGEYICLGGVMYRCVLDESGHGCDWLETAEVC